MAQDITFVIKAKNEARRASKQFRDDMKAAGTSTKQVEKNARRAAQETKKLGVAAKKTRGSFSIMTKTSKLLAGAIGTVIAGFLSFQILSKAITQAREFNAALVETSTLLEGTPAQLAELSSAARDLASTYGGTGAAQLTGFYQAISAGVGGVTEATTLLNTANKLAIGGVTDVTTSVDILTTAINVYGPGVINASEASDALFVAMRAGKTTIGELAREMGQVLPLAQKVGISFDEVAAAIAALTKGGIRTNIATTGLRALIAAIIQGGKEGSEASKVAKKMGIEFNAAALEAKGLAQFLDDVVVATEGNVTAMNTLFGGVEATQIALAFAGTAGQSFAEILKDMRTKAGTTDEAFRKISESLNQRLSVALSQLLIWLEKIGQILLAVVVPAVEFFIFTLKTLGAIVQGTITIIGNLLGFLADIPNKLLGVSNANEHLETAVDNVTLAMHDQAEEAAKLDGKLTTGKTLTLETARVYLALAQARQQDIIASRLQAVENIKAGPLYQDLIRDIAKYTRHLKAAGDETGEAFLIPEQIAQATAKIDGARAALEVLLGSVDKNTEAFEATKRAIALLEPAIENAKGEVVKLAGETAEVLKFSDRLTSSFNAAATAASSIVAALANAPMALLSLQNQGEVLTAKLAAVAGGYDKIGVSAAGLRKKLSLDLGLADAGGPERGRIAANINAQVAQFESNQRKAAEIAASFATSTSGGGGGGGTSAVGKLKEDFVALLEVLDPSLAALNNYKEAEIVLDAAFKSGIIKTQAEYNDLLEQTQVALLNTSDAMEDAQGVMDTVQSSMENTFMSMIDGTMSAAEAFKSMAASIIKELYKVLVVQNIVGQFDPKGTNGGSSGLAGLLGGAVKSLISADGGGYTGNAPRTGGMDGKGGFMAMLHPQETVVDHTKGGGGGGPVVNITQNMNFAEGVNLTARAEILNAMPQIVESAKAGVLEAVKRGGSFGRAF